MTSTRPLEDYDDRRFGPILGVSDEGTAAETIASAAHASAKARAFGDADEMCVGVIIDGERMGSAGELPIGPDEYRQIVPAAQGRTFCTTNVGVRLNARIRQPLPEFRVEADGEQRLSESILDQFAPFVDPPGGMPRPLTVRLWVESGSKLERLRGVVARIEAGRAAGRLGPSELHRLAFLITFEREIASGDLDELTRLIDLATELGVPEVAIDGPLRDGARRRMSLQDLLNVADADAARKLLRHGTQRGVRVVHRYEVDAEAAARAVWTGLRSAQACGLSAAKYGLFPLTFQQMHVVVEHVHRWMSDWTPIPAFYVDTALVLKQARPDTLDTIAERRPQPAHLARRPSICWVCASS